MTLCPACGTQNVPGSIQCARCGASLQQAPQAGYGAPQQGYPQPQAGYPGQPAGAAPNRGLDVGSVVREAADLWQKTLVPCATILFVASLPGAVIGGVGGFIQASATQEMLTTGVPNTGGVFAGLGITLVAAIVAIVLGALAHGAINRIGLEAISGRPIPSVGEAVAQAKETYLNMLGAMFLVAIVLTIGLILCFVPGIIAGVILSLTIPVLVAEKRGPIDAMTRSSQITEGSRMEIFLVFLVLGVVAIVVVLPIFCVLTMAFSTATPGVMSPVGMILQQLVSLALGVVFGSFGAMTAISIYSRITGFGRSTDGAAVAQVFR